jgi:hypothetical protein
VFRTVNDQPTLWDAILPAEALVMSTELSRVDALLDDPVFFAPFVPFLDARYGRPSIPTETYLRLIFLKFRYRLGYESLCREVSDSISWQRFARIPLGTRVPHPTTLMKADLLGSVVVGRPVPEACAQHGIPGVAQDARWARGWSDSYFAIANGTMPGAQVVPNAGSSPSMR